MMATLGIAFSPLAMDMHPQPARNSRPMPESGRAEGRPGETRRRRDGEGFEAGPGAERQPESPATTPAANAPSAKDARAGVERSSIAYPIAAAMPDGTAGTGQRLASYGCGVVADDLGGCFRKRGAMSIISPSR